MVQVTLQDILGLQMPGAILSGSNPLRRNSFYFHYLYIVMCVAVLRGFNFKVYPLSKLQVYNTVLFTIVIMLYVRSPEIIHFV